jgi:hypothetical protein
MIDPELKSAELVSIKRGQHKVLVNWHSGEQSSITFRTKAEAQYYITWVSGKQKSKEQQIMDFIKKTF